jgi:hypothetical protein
MGHSVALILALTAVALLTFLGLTIVTKIILGEEKLIYYHDEIAILITTSLFLILIHQPVLPYIDLTILGLGLFLGCGRVGCLMVGCCHGRLFDWGVCYRDEHVAAGFPIHYRELRLLPVQVIEAISVFVITLVGTKFILEGRPPGSAFIWYVGAYGVVRFSLEFLRGDRRPYHFGFSEAQWLSLILMGGASVGGHIGVLPAYPLHEITTVCLALLMFLIAVARYIRGNRQHLLFGANHLLELAAVLNRTQSGSSKVVMSTTSQGMKISRSTISNQNQITHHVAFSIPGYVLHKLDAKRLADFICKIKIRRESYELLQADDNREIFHVLLHKDKQ